MWPWTTRWASISAIAEPFCLHVVFFCKCPDPNFRTTWWSSQRNAFWTVQEVVQLSLRCAPQRISRATSWKLKLKLLLWRWEPDVTNSTNPAASILYCLIWKIIDNDKFNLTSFAFTGAHLCFLCRGIRRNLSWWLVTRTVTCRKPLQGMRLIKTLDNKNYLMENMRIL